MFLREGILKICSKFTGEYPCQSVISIKLLWNFIEIAPRHVCSPVNLRHIFRTPFPRNTSGWLLLKISAPNLLYCFGVCSFVMLNTSMSLCPVIGQARCHVPQIRQIELLQLWYRSTAL